MMLDIPLHCFYHVQTSVGSNETSRFCLHGAVGASATNGSEGSTEIIQTRFANFIAMARCQFLDQLLPPWLDCMCHFSELTGHITVKSLLTAHSWRTAWLKSNRRPQLRVSAAFHFPILFFFPFSTLRSSLQTMQGVQNDSVLLEGAIECLIISQFSLFIDLVYFELLKK